MPYYARGWQRQGISRATDERIDRGGGACVCVGGQGVGGGVMVVVGCEGDRCTVNMWTINKIKQNKLKLIGCVYGVLLSLFSLRDRFYPALRGKVYGGRGFREDR